MGNGGFHGCLIEPQDVSGWWKETEQTFTHVFVFSRSLLLNHLEPQSRKIKLLLPTMPVDIVAYAFTLTMLLQVSLTFTYKSFAWKHKYEAKDV